MKKNIHILIIAIILLFAVSFTADAEPRFFVNDGSTALSSTLSELYAIGSDGPALISAGRVYALTANGVTPLDGAVPTGGGGLLFDDGSVKVAVDTVKVGLRYYYSKARDTSLEEANLENAVGSGYAFGYIDEARNFVQFDDENAVTSETKITVRPLGENGVGVYITDTDTLLWSMETTGKDAYLAVHPLSGSGDAVTWFSGKRYYGDFAYADLGNGQITVVNIVPVEKYVAGVCAGEMGSAFPLEALKAQAVAARTYMMYYVHNETYFYSYGFDVTADDYCQVYYGYTSANSILSAVSATENQYLTYNGRLIQALFFAADGGSTLDSEEKFPHALPYLRGVEDPYEASVWTRGPYGHRVGMSQWGANAMAKHYDKSYKDILGFYYTKVGLSYGYR